MNYLFEFLSIVIPGVLTGGIIAFIIIRASRYFWPRTPLEKEDKVNGFVYVQENLIDNLRRDIARLSDNYYNLYKKAETNSADIRSIQLRIFDHRFKTNITTELLKDLVNEIDTALEVDTAPQQPIPDQLYCFKPFESSQDDAFSDATGDRIYLTGSGQITINQFEATNEKYLAKYTAPGKVLKYEWIYDGDGTYRCVQHIDLIAYCNSGPFRFSYLSDISTKYPTLLDAQLAAEYYYDNYIKK